MKRRVESGGGGRRVEPGGHWGVCSLQSEERTVSKGAQLRPGKVQNLTTSLYFVTYVVTDRNHV